MSQHVVRTVRVYVVVHNSLNRFMDGSGRPDITPFAFGRREDADYHLKRHAQVAEDWAVQSCEMNFSREC